MDRRYIGRNKIVLPVCIGIFYILAGLFLAGFCHFLGNYNHTNDMQSDLAKAKKLQTDNWRNSDFFQMNKNKSKLIFRQSERFIDNNSENLLFRPEAIINFRFIQTVWLLFSIIACTIILRKCIQVIYMQKSDGKKRFIELCQN